jgi:hypothetical protein
MKSKRNLAEELTETWINFRYEDPREKVYRRAVKVVEECDRVIKLCKWAKEIISNLERKFREKENLSQGRR